MFLSDTIFTLYSSTVIEDFIETFFVATTNHPFNFHFQTHIATVLCLLIQDID